VITAPGIEAGEFKAGSTYEYWLSSLSLPDNDPVWNELVYNTRFPAFEGIPDAIDQFNIFHTSCRKPHGGGRDAFIVADHLRTEENITPHLLLLSGDQVYADDVASPLFPRIALIAKKLVGTEETSTFGVLPPIAGRQRPSIEEFGLTSDAAVNHLWTFGEFVAMYLLAWSDVLWPNELPAYPGDSSPEISVEGEMTQEKWNDQILRLKNYKMNLPKVRKILANVPTLMMFDDHEITDDWNLDYDWVINLYVNNPGKKGVRVVTNGLLAYLLFQHWGNRPDRFNAPSTPESRALTATRWDGSNTIRYTPALLDDLGLPQSVGAPPTTFRRPFDQQTLRYDVAVGRTEGYPLRVALLDERMTREFSNAERPVGRISVAALNQMIPNPDVPNSPLLVVAPAPVVGLHLMEHFIQPAGALIKSPEFVDFETWMGYGAGFGVLLEILASNERAIILSGDVHYGSTFRLEYERPPSPVKRVMAQLTASSAKNADRKTLVLHAFGDLLRRLGIARRRDFAGFNSLGAADQGKLKSPPLGSPPLPYDDVVDILLGRVYRAGLETPAVFSKEVASAYQFNNPDFRYSIEHIDDESEPAEGDDKTAGVATQERNALTVAAGLVWPDQDPASSWKPDQSVKMLLALRAAGLNRIGKMLIGLPHLSHIHFTSSTSSPTFRVTHDAYVVVGQEDDPDNGIVISPERISLTRAVVDFP
jgi:hypothetical protein